MNFDDLTEIEGRSVFVKGYISSLEKESDAPLTVNATTLQVKMGPVPISTDTLVELNTPLESLATANGENLSTVHHTVGISHTVNTIDLSEDGGGEKEEQASITRQTFVSVDHPMGSTTTHTVVTHVSSHLEDETRQVETSHEVEQIAEMPRYDAKSAEQPGEIDTAENDKQETQPVEIADVAPTVPVVEIAQQEAAEEVDSITQETNVLQETLQEMNPEETQPQTARTEETEQEVQKEDVLQETTQDVTQEEALAQTKETEETMQEENTLQQTIQQVTQKEALSQTMQTEGTEQEVQQETEIKDTQQPQPDNESMAFVEIFTEEERTMLEYDQVEAFSPPPPEMEISEPEVPQVQQTTVLPSLQHLMQAQEQIFPYTYLRPMTQTTTIHLDGGQEGRPTKRQRLESSPSPQPSRATPTRPRRRKRRGRETTPFIGPIFLRRSPRLMNKKRPQYFPPSGKRKYKKKSQGHGHLPHE